MTISDALFYPKPVAVPGRPTGAERRAAPERSSSAAPGRRAARGSPRAGPTSSTPLVAARPRSPRPSRKLDAACVAIGRDPSTIVHSVMAGVLVGRTDDEVARREAALLAAFGDDAEDGEAWLEERRDRWVVGTGDAGPGDGPRGSPTPASSGSCSRTSSPGTSTTST